MVITYYAVIKEKIPSNKHSRYCLNRRIQDTFLTDNKLNIMVLNCGQPLPLLSHTDVPARVLENYILTGYRFPNYSLRDCLLSAIRPTNETGNFWTHFLPLFIFFYYFVEVFDWEGAPHGAAPFFYPLWNYFIGVFCLLMASSMAHLLNSMSLVVREVCFFVDYGTISSYTVGSSLAYYYYIHPRAGIKHTEGQNGYHMDTKIEPASLISFYVIPDFCVFFETLYIPAACVVAIFCVLSCCNTRHRWRRHRYVIRTFVFLLPFLISSTPVFYRLLTRSPYSATSSSFETSTSTAGFFYRHCFWLLVSAVFNISKFPERLFPGSFDIWGHSHQWFHCCTFLSILDELNMIKTEVRAILLSQTLLLPPAILSRLPGPTIASTYGVMLLLQTTIVSIIVWFSWHANRIYGPERDELAKEHSKKPLKGH
ncbi:membrane progesterone receptor epsilon [Pungitius pungitius]|uniref:membrane progesterone receptor epsilon n=1 Tax=Pungitius pungitius TaxID=134920 RepID=UPI001888EF58|nr:membrane progesterone receptor epsilon [Pungitius pungitius]